MMQPKGLERYEGVQRRIQVVGLGIFAALGVLCFQLWQLQMVQRHIYEAEAIENSQGLTRLKSSRGVIYGRGGLVLADNRASTDIAFVPGECPRERVPEVCKRLEQLIGINAADLLKKVESIRNAPYTQITIKSDVTKSEHIAVEERSFELPGVVAVASPQRRYLHGNTGGQILGYLSEINKDELKSWQGYYMADLVGRSGVERVYEQPLHGQDGYTLVTKYASGAAQLRTDRRGVPYVASRDSLGHLLQETGGRQEPISGDPLYLTLDMGLQAKAEALLAGERGAIVVLEADTGAVLALASAPGYDPNVFVNRSESGQRQELIGSERMFNRAIQENYPPGSVFKIAMAIAGIEEKIIDPGTHYFCGGTFQLAAGGRPFKCHSKWGHGSTEVAGALAYSCDVFFYNVGVKLDIDRIAKWSKLLGMGDRTGIDLPSETTGIVPSREWKAKRFEGKAMWEQRWYAGETVSVSIGQGGMSTTPLQNAVLMACIVNGGYRVQPFLNAELEPPRSERLFSERTSAIVAEGLKMCVEKREGNPQGTGRLAYIEGMTVIGKTGTAQVVSNKYQDRYAREEDIPYEMRDHAWFVAGVMDREPKIALCVLIEHGLHGGATACPPAKELIEYFYANDPKRPKDKEPGELARMETP